MDTKRRTIQGLDTFLCAVSQCWMTDRGCMTNRAIAEKVISYVEAGIPVWALEDHLVSRMLECLQCERFDDDEHAIEGIIREEVDKLLAEIDKMYEGADVVDEYDRYEKQRKRKWWNENKAKKKGDIEG